MSAFSNIPPQAVLPLGAYDRDELERSARYADQRLLSADLSATHDKAEVLQALALAFGLPSHFGGNLDALYDCITDLKPIDGTEHPGFAVVLKDLPAEPGLAASDRDALLDVFREAADFFFDHDTAFRVFYSVQGRH